VRERRWIRALGMSLLRIREVARDLPPAFAATAQIVAHHRREKLLDAAWRVAARAVIGSGDRVRCRNAHRIPPMSMVMSARVQEDGSCAGSVSVAFGNTARRPTLHISFVSGFTGVGRCHWLDIALRLRPGPQGNPGCPCEPPLARLLEFGNHLVHTRLPLLAIVTLDSHGGSVARCLPPRCSRLHRPAASSTARVCTGVQRRATRIATIPYASRHQHCTRTRRDH
jgi:hypothetical protein